MSEFERITPIAAAIKPGWAKNPQLEAFAQLVFDTLEPMEMFFNEIIQNSQYHNYNDDIYGYNNAMLILGNFYEAAKLRKLAEELKGRSDGKA